MLRTRDIQILLAGIFLLLSQQVVAADCRNEWARPSFQTMSMDSSISFTLTDYKNKERHFSAKQGLEPSADIYFLEGVVLVKGYSEAQLEQFAPNTLSMMPTAFAVPTMILAQAAPQGPCNLKAKTPFSIQLSGAMRLQDRKLSSAIGTISSATPSKISYELDASIDPPAPNKTSIRYSGTMSFAPQEESPPDDTDVTGYLVVRGSRPFPVVGSSAIPMAKLGELRRFLASKQMAPVPINELPMYGGREKNAAMKTADAAFLATIEKQGLSREEAAKQAIQSGWSYWDKRDLATAMRRFNQGWLLDPENGNAYHGFALVTSVRGASPSEVERLFQLAVSKSKVDPVAFVDYGRFLWTQEQLEKSLVQLNKALQLSSTAYNARSNISFVHYLKGDFGGACNWAKDAQKNGDELEKGFLEDMCRRAGK